MITKTPNFWEQTAEKNEVKHGYPPKKNGIILGHPVDYSSAHNPRNLMSYWSIDVIFYLIVRY